MHKIISFFLLLIPFVWLTSCAQQEYPIKAASPAFKAELPIKRKYKTTHEYGGWSCPDNLRGFPPVDIQQLDQVPVVNDRMPTKEETRDGTSLIFFDSTRYPDARPIDMTMPRLARYYSEHTQKNELIIVIQAVVSDEDTVVGFRYVNGGNGSAWFGEVSFLSDEEIDQIGPTPFVFSTIEIQAPKRKIWKVITSSTYAKELAQILDEDAYVESDGKADSEAYFKYAPDKIVNGGFLSASWNNMYIQIDYNFDGHHYAEKFFILDNKNSYVTKLQIVTGPYSEDVETQKVAWANWLQKVKELSEKGGFFLNKTY